MRNLITFYVLIFIIFNSNAQSVGFSYFFPKNGYFGNPIAPINLNLPISFGNYLRISPGIGMDNIGGMTVSNMEDNYNTTDPLVGPFQTFKFSIVPSIIIPIKKSNKKIIEIELMGGYFGFTTLNSKLLKGNFDEMLLKSNDYQMVRSDLKLDPSFYGQGWLYGLQFDFRLTEKIWGFIAGKYYLGELPLDITGTYEYLKDGSIGNESINFDNAKMDYHGFEITIGGGLK